MAINHFRNNTKVSCGLWSLWGIDASRVHPFLSVALVVVGFHSWRVTRKRSSKRAFPSSLKRATPSRIF